jgi:predicted DsbA family dithiol-disulfide isomerase
VRLRRLVEEFEGRIALEHRAFVLVPEDRSREFLPYHLQHRQAALEMTGMPYDLPAPGAGYPRSSWPSQMAAKWVRQQEPERFDAFDLALFEAFFASTEDISSPEALGNIAASAGIDRQKLLAALGDEELAESVFQDHRAALESGINAIPTALFGEYAISGAVPYEDYARAARALLTQR